MILTSIEKIKPGVWFTDGSRRRMMKIQDVLPSGLPSGLVRVNPVTGELVGDFCINAIYENGGMAACPYEMKIFSVNSKDDLYGEEMAALAPTVRHIKVLTKG